MACFFKYKGSQYTREQLQDVIKNEGNSKTPTWLNYTINDEQSLRDLMGINKDHTLEQYLNENYKDLLANLKNVNSTVKLEFNNDVNSKYVPSSNIVSISLSEIYDNANKSGLSYDEHLKFMIQHELTHAASEGGLQMDGAEEYMNAILTRVRKAYNTKPFIDELRGEAFTQGGYPYSLQNIKEMIADAHSNAYFIEYLKSLSNGQESLWDKIIDFLRNIIGLPKKDSIYNDIINFTNSETFKDFNDYATNPYNNLLRTFIDPLYGNNYSLNTEFIISGRDLDTPDKDVINGLKDLDKAVYALKKQIQLGAQGKVNAKEAEELGRLLKSFTSLQDQKEKVIEGMNILKNVWNISVRIRSDINRLKTDTTMKEYDKLVALQRLINQSESIEFTKPFINKIIAYLQRSDVETTDTKTTVSQLYQINAIGSYVSSEYNEIVQPLLIKILAAESGAAPALKQIIDERDAWLVRLKAAKTDKEKQYAFDEVDKRNELIHKIPLEETLQAVFAGKIPDASMFDLQAQAMALNGHAMIQALYPFVAHKDIELSHYSLLRENIWQTATDKFDKALGIKYRNIEEASEKVSQYVDVVKEFTKNDDGTITPVYEKHIMWITEYSPEYIKQGSLLASTLDYYHDELYKSYNETTETDNQKLKDEYEKAKLALDDFMEKFSNREFNDEYYIPVKILNEKIDTGKKDKYGDAIYTTLNKEKGQIFAKIKGFEDEKARTFDNNVKQSINEDLDSLYAELKDLSSKWDANGILKTGFEKAVSDQAIKHREEKAKTGEYTITESDLERFNEHKQGLQDAFLIKEKSHNDSEALYKKQLDKKTITQEQYDKEIKIIDIDRKRSKDILKTDLERIEITKLSDDFYTDRKEKQRVVSEQIAILMEIEEMKPFFSNIDKNAIKEGYELPQQLSAAFRDFEGTVNGNAFQKNKLEAVKVIKKRQEEINKLSEATDKLLFLSKTDSMRLSELEAINRITILNDVDKAEFDVLNKKKIDLKAFGKKYETVLAPYIAAMKDLYSMMNSDVTDYYIAELQIQEDLIAINLRKEIDENFDTYLSDNGIKVEKGVYFREAYDEDDNLVKIRVAESKMVLIQKLAADEAKIKVKSSEWWINNHFDQNVYDKESKGYIIVESPIYIWKKQIATDEKYILKNQPAQIYSTFVPNADMINKNFKLIGSRLGNPKQGTVYSTNQRFIDMQNDKSSDGKAIFEYSQFLRQFSNETQTNTGMLDSQRLFDFVPGIPKMATENDINFTTKMFDKNTYKNIGIGSISASKNDDVQFATSGSLAKNKSVPFRFNKPLPLDIQTRNVFAAVLAYDNINKQAMNNQELEPIFSAVEYTTRDIGALNKKTISGKFSYKNAFNAVFGNSKNSKKIEEEVPAGETVLHKSIKHALDTMIYGESKTSAMFDTFAGTIDSHKVAGSLKNIASKAIFAGKWFSPLKNTIAGISNALVNSGQTKGFFTERQLLAGQVESLTYMPYIIKHDFKKVGNKSFIGQAARYFQVFQGGVHDDYGKLVQWSALTEVGHVLTIAKNYSEIQLQLASFLAICKANPIELPNGNKVSFLDAYEIKDGVFQTKLGVVISKKESDSLILKVAHMNGNVNGRFREIEKAMLQKNPLGGMAFYLNGYVMPGIKNIYSGYYYSSETEMLRRGYFTEAYQFTRKLAIYGKEIGREQIWNDLNKDEQDRIIKAGKSIGVGITLGILAVLMGSGDDTEKLKQNSSAYNFLLALTMAVASEMQTFIPVPGLGGDEILRKIKTPFAATTQILNMGKLISDLLDYAGGGGTYKTDGANHDGFHDKGDAKWVAGYLKLKGWNFSEYDALLKVQNTKQIQTVRP